MRFRKKLKKRQSSRNWRRGYGQNRKNRQRNLGIKRGGYRL